MYSIKKGHSLTQPPHTGAQSQTAPKQVIKQLVNIGLTHQQQRLHNGIVVVVSQSKFGNAFTGSVPSSVLPSAGAICDAACHS